MSTFSTHSYSHYRERVGKYVKFSHQMRLSTGNSDLTKKNRGKTFSWNSISIFSKCDFLVFIFSLFEIFLGTSKNGPEFMMRTVTRSSIWTQNIYHLPVSKYRQHLAIIVEGLGRGGVKPHDMASYLAGLARAWAKLYPTHRGSTLAIPKAAPSLKFFM